MFNSFKNYVKKTLKVKDEEINEILERSQFNFNVKRISNIDIGTDLYNNPNLTLSDKGIYYNYDGIKYRGFIYLKDGYSNAHRDNVRNKDTYIPRFHIVECKTILDMKLRGNYYRYVFSNQPITMIDKADNKEYDLLICQNCLNVADDSKLKKTTATKEFCELYLKEYQLDKIWHFSENTINLMKNFKHDNLYKFFTHRTDNIDIYIKLYENASKIEEFLNEYKNKVNIKTIQLFEKFLPVKDSLVYPINVPFISDTINLTWKSPEVKSMIVEQNKNPWKLTIKGALFSDEIEKFKNLIEIRNDSIDYLFENVLSEYLDNKLTRNGFNLEKNIQRIKRNVFTDVYNLFNGLDIIISWIHKFKKLSNEVLFSLKETSDAIEIEIIHKNSIWQKEINEESVRGGDIEELRKFLFCIADISIIAKDIANSIYQMDLLVENKTYLDISKSNAVLSKPKLTSITNRYEGINYLIKFPVKSDIN